MVSQGGMALAPVAWQEIEAYDSATAAQFTPWEKRCLRQMSEAYVRWRNKGGEQSDIALDVPYIERNEKTLERHRDHLMEQAEKSRKRQVEIEKKRCHNSSGSS